MNQVMPRPEYPRPQFVREGWMNLNGVWEFEMDMGNSGMSRGLVTKEKLDGTILVPFCPESKLSGVGNRDFMPAVWYKRSFTLPEEACGKRVILHFGAVDYLATVWVNGQEMGQHKGGYVPFSFDITDALKADENTVVLRAQDDTRSPHQPSGKQSKRYESHDCDYTRTTGIWQTVWLEWVDACHIEKVLITPHYADCAVTVKVIASEDCDVEIAASFEGKPMGDGAAHAFGGVAETTVKLSESHPWNVGEPKLYDLQLTLKKNGETVDEMQSYFGLRSLRFEGRRFFINDKPVFQRLVLDQGFYPDGVYTAPTDEALKNDIIMSQAMGFNGARLHEKVFEPRFLYHADHLGYLCWGEMANWGLDTSKEYALADFLNDWLVELERDYSAPCIIGWCPFNETWDVEGHQQYDDNLRMIYRITKLFDKTRPCIDTSGNFHVETDIFDVHDYDQNPVTYKERLGAGTKPIYDNFSKRQHYDGKKPVFVSEYGGIWWSDTDKDGWGYGERVKNREEFLARYKGLTDVLLDNPDHFAFCYTQLTDVEQEQNGLYTFDRKPKFPPEVIHRINSRKAACEEE
ncbi:MAG: beta-galactosidase [Clostridiales bacterium]|nr:beta-galactosidase [Clostridiales bacterium]